MNDTIINPYTITTVLIFLIIIISVAFFVKKKSSSLKKIINKKKINIIEYLPIRGGYSAIIFAVEDEKFFFVSHKSGSSNLVQILKSDNKLTKMNESQYIASKNDILKPNLEEKFKKKNNIHNQEPKKPLEQVNISDLLALHKKV